MRHLKQKWRILTLSAGNQETTSEYFGVIIFILGIFIFKLNSRWGKKISHFSRIPVSNFYGKLLRKGLYRSGSFSPGVEMTSRERENRDCCLVGTVSDSCSCCRRRVMHWYFSACYQKSNTEEVLYPSTCGKCFKEQRSTAVAGCSPGIPPQSFRGWELCYS